MCRSHCGQPISDKSCFGMLLVIRSPDFIKLFLSCYEYWRYKVWQLILQYSYALFSNSNSWALLSNITYSDRHPAKAMMAYDIELSVMLTPNTGSEQRLYCLWLSWAFSKALTLASVQPPSLVNILSVAVKCSLHDIKNSRKRFVVQEVIYPISWGDNP